MARNIGTGDIQTSNPHYDRSPFPAGENRTRVLVPKDILMTIDKYYSAIEVLIEFDEYLDRQSQ